MDVTAMPIIGKVTVDIHGHNANNPAEKIHLHDVYNVVKIIDRPEGRYYVTNIIFKVHNTGYLEPLVISSLIATNYEPIGG